jgi:methionine sulfoxide reductase heme-binding subunit
MKPVVFVLCLLPLAWLPWAVATGGLGANPIEAVTHHTGIWALRLLLATLAVTPLRRLTGWHGVIRHRRMLGLFAFFYAALHVTAWVVLDQFFAFGAMWEDLVKRPFITAGMASFLLLVPLAITSTAGWIRRLGGRRWQLLHRLAYVSAAAAVVHFLWLVKSDLTRPLTYAAVLAVLIGIRVGWWAMRSRRSAVVSRPVVNTADCRLTTDD